MHGVPGCSIGGEARETTEAGGPGSKPERLFAAGYAACFFGVMKFVASRELITKRTEFSVAASVGNRRNSQWFWYRSQVVDLGARYATRVYGVLGERGASFSFHIRTQPGAISTYD
jgi:hypothetical protein